MTTLGERMEKTQFPRRLLGAVLSVFVPGAGHVVIGHPKIGWAVAAATLLVGGGFLAAVVTCAMTWVAICGGLIILGTIASVLSVFAIPPGPRLADGLRALWPVLVLFVLFRGAAWLISDRILLIVPAPDDSLKPAIIQNDILFFRVDSSPPRPDELVLYQAADHIVVRRGPGKPDDGQVRGRALFVFAAAKGTNGIDRVWKPLQERR